MRKNELFFRTFSGILLIAGTCIGGGMLALPTRAAAIGLVPSLVVMAICAVFMTVTGLLFFEATLWLEEGAHVISLSSHLLGKPGKMVAWIVYLFIGYASLVGYVYASGDGVALVLNKTLGTNLAPIWGSLIFAGVFLLIIYLGKRFASGVNSLLFAGMILSFVYLVVFGAAEISGARILKQSWHVAGIAPLVPILLTSFSIPGLVPTLAPYLKRKVMAMRIVLIGGLGLSLAIYVAWLVVVIGSTPATGSGSLAAAFAKGELATCTLSCALSNPVLARLARAFELFALATSFLGIGLALFDFLADGLKAGRSKMSRVALLALIGIPSFLFSQSIQRAFDLMIELSGGIGDAILSGLLPALMVWSGRYRKGYSACYRVFGGKPLLLAISFLAGLVLIGEIGRWVLR